MLSELVSSIAKEPAVEETAVKLLQSLPSFDEIQKFLTPANQAAERVSGSAVWSGIRTLSQENELSLSATPAAEADSKSLIAAAPGQSEKYLAVPNPSGGLRAASLESAMPGDIGATIDASATSSIRSGISATSETSPMYKSVFDSPAGKRLYDVKTELEKLTDQLSDGIRAQRWTNVIADDVSGRVPGLVVWNQMKLWNLQQGSKVPSLRFLASGTSGTFSAEEHIANLTKAIESGRIQLQPGRTLIVSEQIESGKSLAKLDTQ